MANKKTTTDKSKAKSGSKSSSTIKPVSGKIVPVSGKIQPVSYRPVGSSVKKSTSSKPSSSKTSTSKSTPSKSKSTVVKPDSKGVVRVNDINKGDYTINLNSYSKKTTKSKAPVKKSGVANAAKTPVKSTASKPKTTPKKSSSPKYVEPGTKAFWAMTPDQRNANTMLNIKESIAGGPKKSTSKTAGSAVKTAAKSAADTVKGVTGGLQKIKDTKKQETPTPRIAKAPEKKSSVSGKNVTSKQGAAKIKGIVEGLERPTAKKTPTKAKPVAPKMATTIGSAKVSVPSKGKVKIEPNLGKPKSFTPPKTETKPKVQTAPKPEPKPELIRMEMIPLATVAKQLQDSQRAKLPSTIEIPKSVATTAKTPAPAEEKKGLFARMKERREERRAERKAEKEAEKTATAKMKKGGIMKKYKTGGMVNPNANLQAAKKAGSKGVMHSLSAKAIVQKIAKGRSGGTSAAPKTALPKAQMGKIVKMTSKVAKAAGKGAKKASGSVLDFRKAATKSDMSKAFSNIERANLKKQLQDLEKAKKG